MLGSIAVEKEIYAGKSAQIGVGLHVGEVKPLRECSNTSHYVFYTLKCLFLVHFYASCLSYRSTIFTNPVHSLYYLASNFLK